MRSTESAWMDIQGKRSTARVVSGGIAALAIAMGIGRFAYTLVLPTMISNVFDARAAGIVASWNYFGYLAGAVFAGFPRLRQNRRAILVVALLTNIGTTAGMALSGEAVWIIWRFVSGVSSGFVFVFATSIAIDELRRRNLDRYSELVYAGVGVGIATSSLATCALPVLPYGADWLIMTGVSAVMLPIALLGFRAIPPFTFKPRSTSANSGRPAAMFPLLIGFFTEGVGYAIPATFIVYFVNSHHALASFRSIAWLIVGVAAIPSTIVWGTAGRRIGNLTSASLAMAVQFAGVVLAAAVPNILTISLLSASLGFTFVGITLLAIRAAGELSRGETALTVSRMTSAFGVGQIIGPVLGSYAEAFHPNGGMASAAAVLGVGTMFMMISNAMTRGGTADEYVSNCRVTLSDRDRSSFFWWIR